MKMTDVYKKIIRFEPYDNLDVFLLDYESFEEIPLVSRYCRLDFLKEQMNAAQISRCLAGLAIYLLSSIDVIAEGRGMKDTFFGITYTDFSFSAETGILIPNFFVYPKAIENGFYKRVLHNDPVEKSLELEAVQACFTHCDGEAIFDFYESRFFDEAVEEELVRVFVIPKRCSLRY